MKRITQEARFRQQMMQYLQHHSAEETARRYRVSRKTVYKWKKRWDGSVCSLEDRSRKPHHSPRKQTESEIKLVRRLVKKYKKDLLLAYQKATEQGYTRSYGCFKQTAWHGPPPETGFQWARDPVHIRPCTAGDWCAVYDGRGRGSRNGQGADTLPAVPERRFFRRFPVRP